MQTFFPVQSRQYVVWYNIDIYIIILILVSLLIVNASYPLLNQGLISKSSHACNNLVELGSFLQHSHCFRWLNLLTFSIRWIELLT